MGMSANQIEMPEGKECTQCGCALFVHVPANPEEIECYECYECGKNFYTVKDVKEMNLGAESY
jgi:hypothetical protein